MQGEEVLERSPNQELLTKNYTEKAIEFIKEKKHGPFFLYLAHSMPHVPLFRSDKFKNISTTGLYGDVIEEIDWSVGQIIKTLRDQGLENNIIEPKFSPRRSGSEVQCSERLGGLLHYYYRDAA